MNPALQDSRIPLLRLGLFLLVAALSFYLGFFAFGIGTAVNVVRGSAYVVLLFSVGGFVWFGLRIFKAHRSEICKAYRHPVAWIVIAGTGWLMFANQPLGYRTVMDEIILSSTSRQFHLEREPLVPRSAFIERGELKVDRAFLDKRPLLYPFFVSILHDTTGYRIENAFYLNVAFSFALLLLAWGIGFAIAGLPGGIFSTVILATLPLIPMMGSGGGFEIANTLFTVIFFLSVWACLEKPGTDSISFLIFATILLAHLRYESALFVLFAGITILFAWKKLGHIRIPASLLLAPFLLIILPLQQQVFEGNEKFWQLDDVEGASSVFSLQYAPDNLGHALNYFLSGENYVPTSLLLFLLGSIGVIFVAIHLRRWLLDREAKKQAMAIFWCALLLQAFLILTYFWGQLDQPIIYRLSFPIWIWFWISALYCFRTWLTRPNIGKILLSISIGTFILFSIPNYSTHAFSLRHAPPEIYNRTSAWANENLTSRSMILTRTAPFWINMGMPSYAPAKTDDSLSLLKQIRNSKAYDGLYLFEPTRIDSDSKSFVPMEPLPIVDRLTTDLIWEFQADEAYGARILKIVDIDASPVPNKDEEDSSQAEKGSLTLSETAIYSSELEAATNVISENDNG
ncbi:hypothetical protein [Puniceicoccus vermicola]|uniref:Glycosyltransferase RgtA/B/C/D-like domain-containing protein n=1 Tax=Puniceicoccus vermicola TaxID=388746 RepID=A0A7X1B360_9BACT|nr:hypothetical protein [Puniceicoccus vermicola]MBC2603570.1 hypothetical protein [Puniceicoccus vermicola]